MRIIERKSPIIEAITKNNKNDEIETINIIIETNLPSYLTEAEMEVLNETTVHLKFPIKKGKITANILVRDKNGGHAGGDLQHGPSVKIYNPKIDVTIIVPTEKSKELKILGKDKEKKDLNTKYSEIVDFVNINRDNIVKIYHASGIKEFDSIILDIKNDPNNKDLNITATRDLNGSQS